jgi:Glycine-rich domain-containing protein-like
MVWHTYMLSPRRFLSDCIRYNKIGLWQGGMPWEAIAASIDNNSFAFNPGPDAERNFSTATGLKWKALEAPPVAQITCPVCSTILNVELTTCTKAGSWKNPYSAGTDGYGFADRSFTELCNVCDLKINHELLRAQRFCNDVVLLLNQGVPMAGTLLGTDGLTPPVVGKGVQPPSTFQMAYPNRLLLAGGGSKIVSRHVMLWNGRRTLHAMHSMADIRLKLEAVIRDQGIRAAASATGNNPQTVPEERIAIRRMMGCYWDNASSFSLDLVGAVIRQNEFVAKMHQIDWLHSPALRATMARLINKYENFFQIMRAYPNSFAVPTLDVDLAWHTHQLSPASYRAYSVSQCGILVNHDDKIDESKLSMGFEWTSKTYEQMFGAVYSECSCWYCEAIRESHANRHTLLKIGKSHKKNSVSQDLERLRAAGPSDPQRAPHISAHNAIKTQGNPDIKTAEYVRKQQLERSYQRAAQRAKKEGRFLPPHEATFFYPTWGIAYPVGFYAPFMGDPCINGDIYPTQPDCANLSTGAPGNCCRGSCGGNAAAGSCGGAGCSGGGGDAGGGSGGDAGGDAGGGGCGGSG